MKKSRYLFRSFTNHAIAVALVLFSLPALSQVGEAIPDKSLGLEEVMVTARKREESLMEIPTAVSVFGFEEMDRRGFFNLEDISDFTAGLYYSNQGGQIPGRYNEAVRFRGLDTNQSAPSQQIATVFLDGVYFPGGLQGLDFSNVERVEVIKGPQSATFGRSTFAGAVNIITKRANLQEYSGRFSGSIADYGTYDTSFSYEGPLIEDRLAARVSVRQYGTDGQYRSSGDGGRLGEERTTSVQASLFGQITEDFTANFSIMYSEDEDGPPAAAFFGGPSSVNGTGAANAGTNCFRDRPEERANGAVADYYCGEIPRNVNINDFISLQTTVSPFAREAFASPSFTSAETGITHNKPPGVPVVTEPGLKREMTHYALDLTYDFNNDGFFDGYTVDSLSGYGETKANWVRDTDLTSSDQGMSQDPNLYEFWSQEVRLTSPGDKRFRWSVGLSYFKAEYTRHGSLGMSVNGLDSECINTTFGTCVAPPYVGGFSDFPKEGGLTKGIFGAMSYDFTERLTLDFEWRYQDDEVSQDDRTKPGVEFVDNFKAFLPRVTLSYHPMDNSTIWATYSKGNMPGFFNAEFTDLSEVEKDKVREQVGNISLFNDEETLKNYEVGWKQTLFGGNAYYSIIAFKMDWEDLKTRQSVPIILEDGTLRALNVQFNAGNAEIKGIEVEGGFSIGEHFTGTVTAEKVDSEYGTLQCSFSPFQRPQFPGNTFGPRDCSGSTPARYPDTSYSFGLNWQDNLGNSTDWDYFVRFDGSYLGKMYSEEANFAWYGKFWRFNLRGGFQKDHMRIEFFADNLFDDDHYLSAARWSDFSTSSRLGFLFNQGIAITPASKRVVGMKVVYEF